MHGHQTLVSWGQPHSICTYNTCYYPRPIYLNSSGSPIALETLSPRLSLSLPVASKRVTPQDYFQAKKKKQMGKEITHYDSNWHCLPPASSSSVIHHAQSLPLLRMRIMATQWQRYWGGGSHMGAVPPHFYNRGAVNPHFYNRGAVPPHFYNTGPGSPLSILKQEGLVLCNGAVCSGPSAARDPQ
jgi:hypothetical protein